MAKKAKSGRKANGQFKKGHSLAKRMGKKGHSASCGLFGSRKKRR